MQALYGTVKIHAKVRITKIGTYSLHGLTLRRKHGHMKPHVHRAVKQYYDVSNH